MIFFVCIFVLLSQHLGKKKKTDMGRILLFFLGTVSPPVPTDILEPIVCWPHAISCQQFCALLPLLSQVEAKELLVNAVTEEPRGSTHLR